MIGPINKSIRGFLGYLGLNQTGKNIQQVQEALQCSLDYTPFLNLDMADINVPAAVSFATGDAGVAKSYAGFTPGQNQIYLVSHLSWNSGMALGDYFAGQPVVETNYNATRYPVAPYVTSSPARSLTHSQGWMSGFERTSSPLILLPTWTLGIYCTDVVSAAYAPRFNVRYRVIDL